MMSSIKMQPHLLNTCPIDRARVAAERAANLADVVVGERVHFDAWAKCLDFLAQAFGFHGNDDFFRVDGDEVGQLVGRFFQLQFNPLFLLERFGQPQSFQRDWKLSG